MGWPEPGPCETVHSIVLILHEQWRHCRDEAREKEWKKSSPVVAAVFGGAVGGDRQRRWWFAVAGDVVCLRPLSPLFFIRFSAFSSSVLFFFRLPDTTKRLMSSSKCRSVEVINNPARPGSNHREVNCINYK